MTTPRSPIQPIQGSDIQIGGENAPFFSDPFAVRQPSSIDPSVGDSMMFDTTEDTFKDLDLFPGTDTSLGFPEDFQWSPLDTASASSSRTANNSLSCPPTDIPDLSSFFAQTIEEPDPQTLHIAPAAATANSQENITRGTSKPYGCGQDCMARALQVVSDLHVGRNTCRTTSTDPMAGMQPVGIDNRDVDAILFQNRDAIRTLRKILDCPCSSDDGVALACYLATSKIVGWYGAAMGLAPHSTTGSSSGVSQGMTDQVIVRPIFMGSYCLDADAQRAVRARVTLSEMREQIQPLLARLPKHQVSRSARPEQSASISPSAPRRDTDGPECALRAQMKSVIQEATQISKAA